MLDDISDLVFRPALQAAGITDDELRRLRAQRRLTVVRRGAYVPSADPRLADAVARHALTVRAATRTMSPHAVVSHVSAAALHRLVLWDVDLDRVHITRNRRSGGRRTTVLHVHTAGLDVDEVVDVDGVAVTSVPRTLADLARTLPFEQALVVADAALHGHRSTPAAFAEAVARAAGREGSPPARRVVAAADPRDAAPGVPVVPTRDMIVCNAGVHGYCLRSSRSKTPRRIEAVAFPHTHPGSPGEPIRRPRSPATRPPAQTRNQPWRYAPICQDTPAATDISDFNQNLVPLVEPHPRVRDRWVTLDRAGSPAADVSWVPYRQTPS